MKKRIMVAIPILIVAIAAVLVLRSGSARPGEICKKHGIAEARDPFCHQELVASMGMCGEHGFPEALCFACHPDLATGFQAEHDWCKEHGVPESQCTLCHPDLLKKAGTTEGASSGSADSIQLVANPEFPRYRRSPNVSCEKQHQRIQFASADIAQRAGLQVAEVVRAPIGGVLAANTEIVYDGDHHAHVSSPIGGVVKALRADLGDAVTSGASLLVLDSAELGAAKGEFHRARALVQLWTQNHERAQELLSKDLVPRAEALEAETELAERQAALEQATEKLRNLGLSDAELERIAESKDSSSRLSIRAPFSGTVIQRTVGVGEVVQPSQPLIEIADVKMLWAIIDIGEGDMAKVSVGVPVVVTTEALRGESFGGRITWVSSQLDPITRTLKARAEIDNHEGLLRANMFGTATIAVGKREPVVVVPREAVQWDGCCNVVFVRRSDVLYEPRQVRLGPESGGYYAVEQGLLPGDEVVTQGSFLLKTEIMKGSIGAGCCSVEHGA